MSQAPRLMDAAARFRARIASDDTLVAPGAPDALTACLAEKAGFEAVYMTGLGATAVRLGNPDLGLLTQTEMAEHAGALVRASRLPVIADADTGYGGPLNVRRTVQQYVQAGVAALHLEDQASPKRCGQLAGVQLVEPEQAALRLAAAVAAREETGSDVVIIGRTDALQPEGIDAALERARRYRDTGVDLLFVDGVKTRAEVEAIAAGLDGPKVVSLVDGTDAAGLTLPEIRDMGFRVALYSVTALFAAIRGVENALAHLKRQGTMAGYADQATYADYAETVGLHALQDFAHRFESGSS
jgi:2-methylisocitrate lyase-like PEP mutase family enzyme